MKTQRSMASECTPLFFKAKDAERDLAVALKAYEAARRQLAEARHKHAAAVAARRREMGEVA
jgi:hypothetical protein